MFSSSTQALLLGELSYKLLRGLSIQHPVSETRSARCLEYFDREKSGQHRTQEGSPPHHVRSNRKTRNPNPAYTTMTMMSILLIHKQHENRCDNRVREGKIKHINKKEHESTHSPSPFTFNYLQVQQRSAFACPKTT